MPILETSLVSLPDRLKQATHDLHGSLESALALLCPPIERARIVMLIERFYGFHAAWEAALSTFIGDEPFLAPRRRAGLAAADLAVLGLDDTAIYALPRCREAGQFANQAEAWGSLYVLEGSTLGGKLISRRLAEESWLPAGGLRYFDPHGKRTGALWRETCERLAALAGTPGEQSVIAGARTTFQRLTAWLQPAYRD